MDTSVIFDSPSTLPKSKKEVVYEDYDSNDKRYTSRYNNQKEDYQDLLNMYFADGKVKQSVDLPVLIARDSIRDYNHPNKKISDFVQEYVFDRLPILDIIQNILSSRWAGVSCSYVQTSIVNNFLVIDDVYTISPMFYVPSSGIYDKKVVFSTDNNGEISIRRKDLIIHSYDKTFSDPYGRSILESIGTFYANRTKGTSAWIEFLSKFGTPFLYATMSSQFGKSEQERVLEGLTKMRSGGVAVFSKDKDNNGNTSCDIEIKETSRDTADFQQFVKEQGREMLTSLGTSSILFDSNESGSYSLGSIHLQMLSYHIKRLQLYIANILTNKIIGPLLLANFNEKNTGKLIFDNTSAREFKELATGIKYLADAGMIDWTNKVDFNTFRQKMGLPTDVGTYSSKISNTNTAKNV